MLMTHRSGLQREKEKVTRRVKGKIPVVTRGWPGESYSITIVLVIKVGEQLPKQAIAISV